MPKTAGARDTERKSCRGDKYDDIISLCLHREFFYFIGFYPIKQKLREDRNAAKWNISLKRFAAGVESCEQDSIYILLIGTKSIRR